jgi:hypothetical protein
MSIAPSSYPRTCRGSVRWNAPARTSRGSSRSWSRGSGWRRCSPIRGGGSGSCCSGISSWYRWSREQSADGADGDDALATLRERYARGDLTDEQFERKVERLLETDTLENAEDRHRRGRDREREDTLSEST